MLEDCLQFSILSFMLMNLWFNTNAFIEYCEIFCLGDVFKSKEYFDFNVENESSLHYTHFLKINYDCFFIRLITCPQCLCLWLNLSLTFFHKNILIFIYSYTLSLFLFYIFSLLFKSLNNK